MVTVNIEDIDPEAGDAEELCRSLADFSRRMRLLESMMDELTKSHPRQWVALTEGDQLFFADTPKGLWQRLQDAGVPGNSHATKYLDPNPPMWIL